MQKKLIDAFQEAETKAREQTGEDGLVGIPSRGWLGEFYLHMLHLYNNELQKEVGDSAEELAQHHPEVTLEEKKKGEGVKSGTVNLFPITQESKVHYERLVEAVLEDRASKRLTERPLSDSELEPLRKAVEAMLRRLRIERARNYDASIRGW